MDDFPHRDLEIEVGDLWPGRAPPSPSGRRPWRRVRSRLLTDAMLVLVRVTACEGTATQARADRNLLVGVSGQDPSQSSLGPYVLTPATPDVAWGRLRVRCQVVAGSVRLPQPEPDLGGLHRLLHDSQ
jgi:hypothetical protein